MSNNLNRTEVSVNQTLKEDAINNSDAILDGAITNAITYTWSGVETLKTASNAETRQNVVFIFAGSTAGTPAFKFGDVQRGLVLVQNNLASSIDVTDYTSAETVTVPAGVTTAIYVSATGVYSVLDSATLSGGTTTDVLTGTSTGVAVTPDALASLWEQGSDVASAGTITIGEGGYFNITGTTTITDIDFATDKTGRKVWLKFAASLTLTHNATTLILPGGASIVTADGDTALFVSEGSDAVRCLAYNRASGAAVSRVIDVNDSSAGLRVTQSGSGNILELEDSANPDSTPTIVDASGRMVLHHTTTVVTKNANNANLTPSMQIHGTTTADVAQSNFSWQSGTGAATYIFSKSRSGTIGTHTVVQSGDDLGGHFFNGSDGTAFIPAGYFKFKVAATPSSDMPGKFVIATTPVGGTTGVENFFINHYGAIGVAGESYGSAGQVLKSAGSTGATVWGYPTESLIVAASDETTALTTGAGKVTFRMPYAFTVTAVRASLTTAQSTGSIITIDINESGTSILGTKLTIDNTEKTSTTAATAATITDANLADDAEITVDIDTIGDGTAKGLKIYLIGTRA